MIPCRIGVAVVSKDGFVGVTTDYVRGQWWVTSCEGRMIPFDSENLRVLPEKYAEDMSPERYVVVYEAYVKLTKYADSLPDEARAEVRRVRDNLMEYFG